MSICNRDCFNCIYPDCIEDRTNFLEMLKAKRLDKDAGDSADDKQKRARSSALRYYYRNREARIKYACEYHATHQEQRKAYRKKYYQEHREEAVAYAREYRRRNRDKVNEYHREYYSTHKEERKQYYLRKKAERTVNG